MIKRQTPTFLLVVLFLQWLPLQPLRPLLHRLFRLRRGRGHQGRGLRDRGAGIRQGSCRWALLAAPPHPDFLLAEARRGTRFTKAIQSKPHHGGLHHDRAPRGLRAVLVKQRRDRRVGLEPTRLDEIEHLVRSRCRPLLLPPRRGSVQGKVATMPIPALWPFPRIARRL